MPMDQTSEVFETSEVCLAQPLAAGVLPAQVLGLNGLTILKPLT